ncbi:MAG: hypothetical protein K2I80_10105 [Ruminococcus sp.]|nr:hypothetical protein [Ruminococcus sp.]MDE6848568.1 hypothetical protein [Ruminococcus sp.]
MHRNVPKKTLTRRQPKSFGNPELDNIIKCLEFSKESGDEMWRELVFTIMEEIELYQSEDERRNNQEVKK